MWCAFFEQGTMCDIYERSLLWLSIPEQLTEEQIAELKEVFGLFEGNGLFCSQDDKNDQTMTKIANEAKDLYLRMQ